MPVEQRELQGLQETAIRARGVDDFAPFVVFGASKSGTTWLQMILDTHPEVRCHFQLPVFPLTDPKLWHPTWPVYDAARSPFRGVFKDSQTERRYRLFSKYLERMNVMRPDFVPGLADSGEEDKKTLEALNRRVQQSIVRALLCDDESKSIFGTKSYTDLDLWFDTFPHTKLVHIVRDGRDVCVSKRFHWLRTGSFYLGDEKNRVLYLLDRRARTRRIVQRLRGRFGWFGESWFQVPNANGDLFNPNVLTKIAVDWKLIVRYLMDQQKRHPSNSLMVRYEAVLSYPHREIERILNFLGADAKGSIVDQLVRATQFAKLQDGEKESFFRSGRAGDWHKYFAKKDIALFKDLAGDLLLELGYEASNEWGL